MLLRPFIPTRSIRYLLVPAVACISNANKDMQAFPWPAGKAPWLKENGGTGDVPEGALEKLELSRFYTYESYSKYLRS